MALLRIRKMWMMSTKLCVHSKYRYNNDISLEDEVDKFINSTNIVMFSKTTCGFCMMAKSILNKYSDNYGVMEINKRSDGYKIQNYLYKKTGSETVPQIFIDGSYIGGCTDIMTMHNKDEIKSLISK